VPKHTTLAVPPTPVRQEPAFFSRLFSGLRGGAQTDWARRNRMRGRVHFHHNLLNLFPPETYTATHPEFFPVQNGQRFLPPTNDTHAWQPCFTAPGIVEEAVANITRYFEQNPDAASYSLGANDSSGYCSCDACLARIPGDRNFLNRMDYSDLYYDWTNRVIAGVGETYPDKWFGCLAYSEVAAPPRNVDVHPRLIPFMTYDRMKWIDPEIRATGEELTRAWHEKSPVLGWYDYIYGSPYCLPRVWFHHMADYYRFGHANGVRALYAEAYPNWGEGPKLYVSLKLQWDPSRDVDELLDEWFVRCVGAEAAPYLAKYYAHWEDFWTRRILDSAWFSKGGQYLSFHTIRYLHDIDLDEIRESRTLLETALAKAQTDKQKARAALLLRAFEYYEATAYACKAAVPPGGGPMESEEAGLAFLDGVEEGLAYAVKRRRLALDEFPTDPVLVHPIPMTQSSDLQKDALAGGLWAVYDVAAAADGPLRQRLRTLAREAESPGLQAEAAALLALAEGGLEPLTTNPGFEAGDGPAADGWSWWVKWGVGSMRRTDATARSGAYSCLCDGMKRGGPHQTRDITPGTYALTCFVYAPDGQASDGTVQLSLTLRDADGKDLPSASTKIVPRAGRWTGLAVVSRVPEGAAAAVRPIVIVDGFEPGQKVYVDDVELYRLDE
ncbi:MAG: DUF4838 domain-containing protein, partial [Candidatus Hydrogenedentes bacterium]|nr:DUF4838 domain-containing protein [Candidatus Hydrogenedentota bacterium]